MTSGATPYGAYLRIAGDLRDRIANGAYVPGSRLPSEAALCEEFAVTRTTIRRALSLLQDEGLIQASAGVGRFVRKRGDEGSGGFVGTVYQRIAGELRARIVAGEYLPGDRLPGELRISERYGVSRHSAQRALVELEKAGLVVCVHGRGRIVRAKTSPDDPSASVDVR